MIKPQAVRCGLMLSAVLFLGGVVVKAQECRSVCKATTSCSTACYVNGAVLVSTTCGGGGFPCATPPPPKCTPNYQVVNSYSYIYKLDHPDKTCDEYLAVVATEHDVNNCPGSTDRTSCSSTLRHHGPTGSCCSHEYCGYANSCHL
jgi:hypothetical protein